MTETLSRPRVPAPSGRPGRPRLRRPRPVTPAAVLACLGATVVGLTVVELLVLVTWASDVHTGAGAGEALRFGADLWLLGVGAGLRIPGGHLTLIPLGLTGLHLVLLARSVSRVARSRPALAAGAAATDRRRDSLRLVCAVGVGYGALATAVAALAAGPVIAPRPVAGPLGAGVLGLLAAGWVVARQPGWAGALAGLPLPVRAACTGALCSVAALAAAAAVLVGAALGLQHRHAEALAAAVRPGAAGGAALTLLQATVAPNAVVWSGAMLAGPGFAVGRHTSVTAAGASVGQVPALPLLAAVPHGPVLPSGLALLLVAPVAAGGLGGWVAVRRYRPVPAGSALRQGLLLAGTGGLVGLATGAAAGLACALSGGSAGPGRLAVTGPSAWQVGISLAVEVGLPAALVCWLLGTRRAPVTLPAG